MVQVQDRASDVASAITEAKATLHSAIEKGRGWLLDHVAEDGCPDGAEVKNAYYRLPWTLTVLGERDAAATVMSWMEREVLTETGDLREGTPRADFTSRGASYPLSLMACGAFLLERYDTAGAIMKTLADTMTNPATGGAYWERSEVRSNNYELAYPTAQLGLTALMLGEQDIADGVWCWFQRFYAAQPELPQRIYGAWGPDGLVTDPVEAERFRCILDFDKPRQVFYIPGISASFLIRYYMKTGERRARNLALELLLLNQNGTEAQFNDPAATQICKFGWASGLAYEIDPDGPHLANFVRMTRWYADSQAPDGSWTPSKFLLAEPQVSDAMYKTAEHTLWVSYMLSSISGHGRRIIGKNAQV